MVRAYLDCGRYFAYRYIRKLPAVLDGRMLAGRVYDHGVSYALKRKISADFTTVGEVKDIMSDRWEYELKEQIDYDDDSIKLVAKQINWGDDDPGHLKDIVLKLGALYVETILPKLQPLAVQERLEGVIGGVPFVGYPDVIVGNSLDDLGVGIIDHKFTTRRATQEAANKDMQFSSYASLLKRPVWAAWHQALDQKKPSINVVVTERKQGDMDWFGCLVAEVWRGIQAGVFPPNPLTWRCGEKCPYQMECRILCEY